MADNIPIAGGYVVGTKESGGVHIQKTTPVDQTGTEILPATAAKQDAEAALIGAVNETAPGSDTGSAGLNGRLQRIAQRLTSLIALFPASIGGKARSASLGVALATEDKGVLDDSLTALAAIAANTAAAEYEVVEASQTDQMCGTTGAAGDALNGLLIIPLTTSPGAVSIEDGSTNTVVFAGGATSVATLIPFFVDLQGIKTVSGGWEITTGADVRVIAFGNFT